jgi:hypothetical protein
MDHMGVWCGHSEAGENEIVQQHSDETEYLQNNAMILEVDGSWRGQVQHIIHSHEAVRLRHQKCYQTEYACELSLDVVDES